MISFRKMKAVFIILTILASILLLLTNVNRGNTRFRIIDSVDSILFEGDSTKDMYQPLMDETYIRDRGQQGKQFDSIFSQARNIYFFGLNKENIYYFTNNINTKYDLDLKQTISEDMQLEAVYRPDDRSVDFILPDRAFSLQHQQVSGGSVLYSLSNILNTDLLLIGDRVLDVGNKSSMFYISIDQLKKAKINKFAEVNANLLNDFNPSFSNGLWTKSVNDCSNTLSGEPKISMSLERSPYSVLKLSSSNHFACTGKIFPVPLKKDSLFKLMFDYRSIKGNQVQYNIRLTGKEDTSSKTELIDTSNSSWNTFTYIINPKYNYDNLRLYFYAPSNNNTEITNLYDNVRLMKFTNKGSLHLNILRNIDESIKLKSGITLQKGQNEFIYQSTSTNLLSNENSSFEEGLWQTHVNDCCISKPGTSDISMSLSEDSTDGNKCLRLSSKNHCACTNTVFNISTSNDINYKLSFDYKNISGDDVKFYYKLKSSNGKSETYSSSIKANNHEWNHVEKNVNTKLEDINKLEVYFYSISEGDKEVSNLYDNVKLSEAQPKNVDSYFLFKHQDIDERKLDYSIEYKQINLWSSVIRVHGATRPFIVVSPDKYSSNIMLYPYRVRQDIANHSNLTLPKDYFVSELESNRQASRDEVVSFIEDKKISSVGTKYISKNIEGAVQNDNMLSSPVLTGLTNTALAEDIHFKINDYNNAWWIDVSDLCEKRDLCSQNIDGSYEIYFVLQNRYFDVVIVLIALLVFFDCCLFSLYLLKLTVGKFNH